MRSCLQHPFLPSSPASERQGRHGKFLLLMNENSPPPQQSKCFSEGKRKSYSLPWDQIPPISSVQGHTVVRRVRDVVLSPVFSYRYHALSTPQALECACFCFRFIQGFLSGWISDFQSSAADVFRGLLHK